MKDSHALRDGTQSVPNKCSHAEHGNEGGLDYVCDTNRAPTPGWQMKALA